ncbi:MAG: right-handed parallel beta-helix repeat-containing protein [Actinomycetota bacterium]
MKVRLAIQQRRQDRARKWMPFVAAATLAGMLFAGISLAPKADTAAAARPSPTPTTPTPTPTPTGIYSPPPSIASDCSISVTAGLSSWLATVPDLATISFPAGACYRIDETFTIRERTGLTFEGNGAIFRAVTDGLEHPDPRNRAHWRLMHVTDIVVRNLRIEGPNENGSEISFLEAQHAFDINGGVRVTLSSVSVEEVFGDGVHVSRGLGTKDKPLPPRDSEDVLVADSSFEVLGRQGFAVTSARRATFRGNEVSGVQRSAVDIEPRTGTNVIEDILIDSNDFSDDELYMVAGGGTCTSVFRNVSIVGNTAEGFGPRLGKIGCPHRQNLVIESNTITVPSSNVNQGILAVKWSGVSVRFNTFALEDPIPGVEFQSSSGNLIVQNNLFCGASAAYVADAATGPVSSSGNTLNC